MNANLRRAVHMTARMAHQVNRAYCASIGDVSQPHWRDAPRWQHKSAEEGVLAHFTALENGEELSPAEIHQKWLDHKREEGWKWGTVKDVDKKEHPCFMAYEQLPVERRVKDFLFSTVCKEVYETLKGYGELHPDAAMEEEDHGIVEQPAG